MVTARIARTALNSRLRSSRRWSARGIRPSGSFSCLRAVLSTHVLVSCGSRRRCRAASVQPCVIEPADQLFVVSRSRSALRRRTVHRLADRAGAGGVAGGGLDGTGRDLLLGGLLRGGRALFLHRLGLALENAGRLAERLGEVGQLLRAEEQDDDQKDEAELQGLQIAEHKKSTFSPGRRGPVRLRVSGVRTGVRPPRWL